MAEQTDLTSISSVQSLDLPDENFPCEYGEEKATKMNYMYTDANGHSKEYNAQEIRERTATLTKRKKSVKILVTGLTGTGKSSLINAMMGSDFTQTGIGPNACQKDIELHKHEYQGIRIKIYDTRGFGDSVSSEKHIIKNISTESSLRGFDLILITIRMDCRLGADIQKMLQAMSQLVDREMWRRTVVVLTFANNFLMQLEHKYTKMRVEAIRESMIRTIDEFRQKFQKHVTTRQNRELIANIPFVVASSIYDRFLPIDSDWLVTLWNTCILHCREEVRPFLKSFRYHRLVLELKVAIKKLLRLPSDEEMETREENVVWPPPPPFSHQIEETTFIRDSDGLTINQADFLEQTSSENNGKTIQIEDNMTESNEGSKNIIDNEVEIRNIDSINGVININSCVTIQEESSNRRSSVIIGLEEEIMSSWKSCLKHDK